LNGGKKPVAYGEELPDELATELTLRFGRRFSDDARGDPFYCPAPVQEPGVAGGIALKNA
jgi:hypothetical protein